MAPHLSGRSRAILKEYFDEPPATRLPVGHTTVSFTEPQVYHLLRVLTDETLSRSFSTMERMVVDAVRGKPAVAPSRTSHFTRAGELKLPGQALVETQAEATRKENQHSEVGIRTLPVRGRLSTLPTMAKVTTLLKWT